MWIIFCHYFPHVVIENKLRYGCATFEINYYYALSAKESVEINQKWIDFHFFFFRIIIVD